MGDGPWLGVLGPTLMGSDGAHRPASGLTARLLAALAVGRGPVSTELLLEVLWGGDPPATARPSLHNTVARARAALGSDAIRTAEGGYDLDRELVSVDVDGFRADVARARASATDRRATDTLGPSTSALSRWRGVAFASIEDGSHDRLGVEMERRRLDSFRLDAEDLAAAAALALGHGTALGDLEVLCAEEPYRERRWWLLALGFERDARHRDALNAVLRARQALSEVGLVPGQALIRLDRRLAADDPTLLSVHPLDAFANEQDEEPDAIRIDTRALGAIGRTDELDALASAWSGSPPVVTVTGEGGIGKSTLLREVATRCETGGAVVVSATCDRRRVEPYRPVATLIETLAQRAPISRVATLPDRAALVQTMPTLSRIVRSTEPLSDLDVSPRRLVTAVVDSIEHLADGARVVLVVDDLQWAGAATITLLQQCVDSGRFASLVVAERGSSPTLDGGPESAHVHLQGLDPASLRTLVAAHLGAAARPEVVPETVVTAIRDRTAGNPFLVEELVSAMLAEGSLRQAESSWVIRDDLGSVPDSLRDPLRRRIEGLSSRARNVLEAVAVLGDECRRDDLAQLVGGEVDPAVEEGIVAGVLVEDGASVRFVHDLLRMSVDEDLAPERRLDLHAAATSLFDMTGRPASSFVVHAVEAAPVAPGLAVSTLRRAAAEAARSCVYGDAVSYLSQASELVETGGTTVEPYRIPVAIDLAEMLRRTSHPDAAEAAWEAVRSAEASGDAELLARAALTLCRRGPMTTAGRTDREALRVARDALAGIDDPELSALLCSAASFCVSLEGDATTTLELFDRAEELARKAGDEVMLRVLPPGFFAAGAPRHRKRFVALGEEMFRLAERFDDDTGRWSAAQYRFAAAARRGDLDGAKQQLAALHAATDRLAEPGREAGRWYLEASYRHLIGDLVAAEKANEQVLVHAEAFNPSRAMAVYGAQLLALRDLEGRVGELFETAVQLRSSQPGVPGWDCATALAGVAAGEREVAGAALWSFVDAVPSLRDDFTFSACLAAAGRAAALLSDDDACAVLLDELGPFAGSLSWTGTCTVGPNDEALGAMWLAVGDEVNADRHLRAAEGLCQRAGLQRYLDRVRAWRAGNPG